MSTVCFGSIRAHSVNERDPYILACPLTGEKETKAGFLFSNLNVLDLS
jgi:hypothetical protein